jgi:hypothetical protein
MVMYAGRACNVLRPQSVKHRMISVRKQRVPEFVIQVRQMQQRLRYMARLAAFTPIDGQSRS